MTQLALGTTPAQRSTPLRRLIGLADRWSGLLMVGPALVLYLIMLVVPVFLAGYLSLTDWDGYSANPAFLGLANYLHLIGNPEVLRAGAVTLLIALVGTLLLNGCGLGLALLVGKASRLNSFFRMVLFYPHVLSALVVGFLWSAILGSSGVVNSFLTQQGAQVLPFLARPGWAVGTMIAVLVWSGFGVNLVLYIAGLQTVSSDLIEAARIDGAGRGQVFRQVTFPALAPVVTINLVLCLVTLLKTYDLVVSLTAGGPAGATQTAAYLILSESFHNSELGLGSAQSVVLMVITGVLALSVARLRARADAGVRA